MSGTILFRFTLKYKIYLKKNINKIEKIYIYKIYNNL